MVRLGALKHHAKVLRHRETKQQEAERLRAAAHAKALERARRMWKSSAVARLWA